MKNIILLLALGVFLSTNAQNTLKLKTIKTNYLDVRESVYYTLGELDGTVLNPDTLTLLAPEMYIVNISNDTFSSDVLIETTLDFFIYDTTGSLLDNDHNVSRRYPIMRDLLPNDTTFMGLIMFPFSGIIDYYKGMGIELEQISYWKLIAGVSCTSKDGKYSDSIFYAGADTSIFYVVKTPVSIQEVEQAEISIYPNPAQSQFTVTNTENANLTLYSILGQKVKQIAGTGENALIYTEDLPQGIYMLKVERGDAVLTKKVQIIK